MLNYIPWVTDWFINTEPKRHKLKIFTADVYYVIGPPLKSVWKPPGEKIRLKRLYDKTFFLELIKQNN